MRLSWLLLAWVAGQVGAGESDMRQWEDGADLENFVSRPDLRAPRMMVRKHRPEQITDGYWFMTPYSHFEPQHRTPRKEFTPYQTGAHIYDSNGMLIWSGAYWAGNRNIFAFRPIQIDGKHFLSMYLPGKVLGHHRTTGEHVPSGIVLDNHYQEVSRVNLTAPKALDFHEFALQPDGRTALVITTRKIKKPAPELNEASRNVMDMGFREVDISSGKTVFEWNPLEAGVLLSESCDQRGRALNHSSNYWDYLHMNSVDKNSDGDYLVSGRHTSTIYKVSGHGGHILWRLGGYASNFEMESGLEFSWQHDARFLYQNQSHTVISVFDNASEDEKRSPNMTTGKTSAKLIILNTASSPMTAKVLRRIYRPDGNRSSKLGNVQLLGKNHAQDHVFVNWALQGYISEHNAAGETLFEARFQSKRMSSYRAYKHAFVGEPAEPPNLKILPTTVNASDTAGAFYVSWNGATGVASWVFYARLTSLGAFEKIGSIQKTGFETSWVAPKLIYSAYVEAIDERGEFLGRSTEEKIGALEDGEYKAFSPIALSLEVPSGQTTIESSLWHQTDSTPPSINHPTAHTVTSALANRIYKVALNSFAIWGLYCAVRKVVHRDHWRRQGYKLYM